jgi:predicted GNAT family acetyltransferase
LVETVSRAGDRFVLWDVDGVPVRHGAAAGARRRGLPIGPVYTPRNHRGRGYGSAVTAAAAALAHRDGTPDVVLFTDLANPVSNAIYRRIGFEPVVDVVWIDFARPG